METEGKKVDLLPGRDLVSQRVGGLISLINRVTGREERRIDRTAFSNPWSEDMCAALRMEIEEKPEGIDTDRIIEETYSRLVSLLGPPRRKKISLRNRIIFTDLETLRAFRYLYEQPSEDSDKYWEGPIFRTRKTRGDIETTRIYVDRALTFYMAGFIMLPNEKRKKALINSPEELAYLDKHGVSEEEYSELEMKRYISHETTHLLYYREISQHSFLEEPIVDYLCLKIFPELEKLTVQLEWAKAAVEDYMRQTNYHSIRDLVRAPHARRRELIRAARTTREKYFSRLSYEAMGLSESTLAESGVSKFAPIPSS